MKPLRSLEGIEKLEDEVRELNRKIRKAKRERKEQPPLLLNSIDGNLMYVYRYRVIPKYDGNHMIVAERKRPATSSDIITKETEE